MNWIRPYVRRRAFWPKSVEQVGLAELGKLRQAVRPARDDLRNALSGLNGLSDGGRSHDLVKIFLMKPEFIGVHVADGLDDMERSLKRPEDLPVRDMDLASSAQFVLELRKRRGEPLLPEGDPGEAEGVELHRQLEGVNPGSPEKFEGSSRSPSLGDVRALEKDLARIDGGRIKSRHVRRGNDPGQACFVKPHVASPAFHGNDGQFRLLL